MATGPMTQVSDIITPEIFTPYVAQLTEEKARIVQSGALMRNGLIDSMLSGGGITFNVPSFRDLDGDDADNVSTDDVSDYIAADYNAGTPNPRLDAEPFKIETSQEIAVRLSRNNSWSSADLAAALAGADPMDAIAQRVAYYWTRRLQQAFIATWNGVILDNVANDASDYINDVSGAAFVDGVTNFSAEAFLDAAVTMGDSMEDLTMVMVHSVVYNRMQKNNLIDFIPDARGETQIATFLGREVIVDDGLPVTGSVYDTWLFGSGASQFGVGSPKVPTEVHRLPLAGNGGGQEVLTTRTEWCIHPTGHAYTGTAPSGGPGNGTGANALNNAGSWNRVYAERKQIKFARLVTREA
jgi:hypothetical protein